MVHEGAIQSICPSSYCGIVPLGLQIMYDPKFILLLHRYILW